MGLKDEGTVELRVGHRNAKWASDNNSYTFPEAGHGGITLQATKHPDSTIEVRLSGARGIDVAFQHPMPATVGVDQLHIAVTWKASQIKLYLDGVLIETMTIPPTS